MWRKFSHSTMGCNSTCQSCKDSLYTRMSNKNDSSESLLLPSIMSFTPISTYGSRGGSMFPSLGGYSMYPPLYTKNGNCMQAFPPLFGLSMKFGDGNPVTFTRAKIDFSVESITSNDKPSSNSDAIIRSNTKTLVSSTPEDPFETSSVETKSTDKPLKAVKLKNRGRPSADSINNMIYDSQENCHRYQCPECNRGFPRKKSLDTHRLTHCDIKPYSCDFPGCVKKFKQSGQLKTHLRLHTGEKPFHCTFPFCSTSFAHANRKCSQHPEYALQRVTTEVLSLDVIERVLSIHRNDNIESETIKQWLHKQFVDRIKTEYGEKTQINSKASVPRKVLKSIENIQSMEKEGLNKIEKIQNQVQREKTAQNLLEENNRRMLSAVALVELQAQAKKTKEEKFG